MNNNNENAVKPAVLEHNSNVPSVDYRKFPQQSSPSKFYLWLQAFVGPFLAVALSAIIVALLYMWSDFRLIRGENIRLGEWQHGHSTEHRAFETWHYNSDIAEASVKYKVADCRVILSDLVVRMRQCEADTKVLQRMLDK